MLTRIHSSRMHRTYSLPYRGGLCPGCVSVHRVSVSKGCLCPGGLCPGWSLSRGSLSWVVSVQGLSVLGGLCLADISGMNMGPETETPWKEHGTRELDRK